jgi:hypothetical protein
LYYSLGYGGQEVNIETVKFLLSNNADATIANNAFMVFPFESLNFALFYGAIYLTPWQ